jgi:enamine deaminase RidA (YjgF/YER057c/UK114 family)
MTSFQTTAVTRIHSDHGDVITLDRDRLQEQWISARRNGPEELLVFDEFPSAPDQVVAQMAFGGRGYYEAARARMGGAEWPLLWLQGDVCPGRHVSGAQAFVILGQALRRVRLDSRIIGTAWSDSDAEYCLLAGVLPADLAATRGAQTRSCFVQMETALQQAAMDFSHVVRTWLYLDDLLSWYGEFNEARNGFFKQRGVFERLIPASTGIGASNPSGAALACGALAVRPRHCGVRICEVESPLQRPATEYRSSFSRAVEMACSDHRLLTISGTASISSDGKSIFAGDVVKQIHRTLDVVEAILSSRGMNWENTTRAVGYFHDIRTLPLFDACCRERGIAPLPLTPAHATICRADLLFEMELDAIATL